MKVSNEFDIDERLNWFEENSRSQIHPNYSIQSIDLEPIAKILTYFFGKQEIKERYGMDATKGLLISGPIGCGKTTVLRLLSHTHSTENGLQLIYMNEIRSRYAKYGLVSLGIYYDNEAHFNEQSDIDLNAPHYATYCGDKCFDDIGTESETIHFGNRADPMVEILNARYNRYCESKFNGEILYTHCTSNLTAKELGKRYGNRIASRMAEMFNIVAFDSKSRDKRRN